MKFLFLCSALALSPAAVMAAGPSALGPNGGKYNDWTAATYGSGTAKICYAFTNAQAAKPSEKPPGKTMLTVTDRAGSPDEVSVTVGYDFPKNAKVKLAVGDKSFDFYTQKNVAFTASGKDAVAAFQNGDAATASGPAAKGKELVTNQFSLSGFSAAYKAISDACS